VGADRHGEHLHRLTRQGWVNVYLVSEEDGLTVVDTAIRGSAKRILAGAAELGAPIRRVVLTHDHPDHGGSVDALLAAAPGIELMLSAREARLARGDRSLDAGEPEPLKGRYVRFAAPVARELEPGERVGSLEVVAAPGHTPGQVAFLDTRDRTLIAGDAFTSFGRVATSAELYWRFPLATSATWHKPTAVASARALRALDPSRLAVGHGPVVEDPDAAMDAAIARVSG